MYTRKFCGLVILLAFARTPSAVNAQGPKLGKPISEADVSGWDINVLPDGTGLPSGSGTPADGARIYSTKCAGCHGQEGKGGSNAKLVGGEPIKSIDAEKTIANFWPYSTTVFDYIRRTMPFRQPRSLTNDEVYALTAYILSINKIIGANDTMNAQTLPKVRMPNRDGFIIRFPDKTP
jgi:S-disulfanyl-L-cysteine oxidoreductase SoxD